MDIIKNILGSTKKRGGKNDWDFDGVPNRKDCQPRNTMRQDKLYYYAKKILDNKVKAIRLMSAPGGTKYIQVVTPDGQEVNLFDKQAIDNWKNWLPN